MAPADLITIRQAAAALHLSEARVHQLLATGDLEGIALLAGRKRHAPGGPRVTADSVERLRSERVAVEHKHEEARAAARARREGGPQQRTAGYIAGGRLDVEAARAAALELKARLDDTRDLVRKERERADRLLEVSAQLLELLRDSSTSADGLDDIAEGYSEALTQLLTPGIPPAK